MPLKGPETGPREGGALPSTDIKSGSRWPPSHAARKCPARPGTKRLIRGTGWPAWLSPPGGRHVQCVQLQKYPARSSLAGRSSGVLRTSNIITRGNVAFGRLALFASGHPGRSFLLRGHPVRPATAPGRSVPVHAAGVRKGPHFYPSGVGRYCAPQWGHKPTLKVRTLPAARV